MHGSGFRRCLGECGTDARCAPRRPRIISPLSSECSHLEFNGKMGTVLVVKQSEEQNVSDRCGDCGGGGGAAGGLHRRVFPRERGWFWGARLEGGEARVRGWS